MSDLPPRFWAKVEKTDTCWNWTASLSTNGAGQFSLNGRPRMAYRVCYEALIGPVPDGLELDHLCRNRTCVNPDHLEPVTHRENILRGTNPCAQKARQTHCVRGHEFTAENTYHTNQGGRQCRKCHVINQTNLNRRKRAAISSHGTSDMRRASDTQEGAV